MHRGSQGQHDAPELERSFDPGYPGSKYWCYPGGFDDVLVVAVIDWVNLCEAIGGLASLGATYVAYKMRGDSRGDREKEDATAQVAAALSPVTVEVAGLKQTLNDHVSNEAAIIQAAVERGVGPLVAQVSVLEAKVELFWRGLAIDSARVLHHPHPQRARIDELLEAWGDRPLTFGEKEELRGYLESIRDHEPDQDVGFPVYAGEQASAVTFLNTMKLAQQEPPETE